MEQGPDGESEVQHQEDLQARVILSLDIFQTVRQNQAQHGLRHNDFKRYRHVTAGCPRLPQKYIQQMSDRVHHASASIMQAILRSQAATHTKGPEAHAWQRQVSSSEAGSRYGVRLKVRMFQ